MAQNYLMKRKTRQRFDFFAIGAIGVLLGAVLVISLLWIFEGAGFGMGFNRPKYVYINGSETFEDVVFSVIEKNKCSVVHISAEKEVLTFLGRGKKQSTGSGFIITDDGYIVTNNHVISDGDIIMVTLDDGKTHEAKIVGADSFNDIAVIKIGTSGLDPVVLGDSDNVRQGELVFALGSPYQLQNTITTGIASAVGRKIELDNGFEIENVIQTDAAINPGNSGGPLINSRGEVIGVNTAIISSSGGSEGVGFAVPINTVKRIAEEIIDRGSVRRPWFGIIGTSVDYRIAGLWSLSVDYGVLIIDFDKAGNAKNSGLRETISTPEKGDFVMGDIITALDDKKVISMDDFINKLMKYRPGDTVIVEYYRGGEKQETEVILEEKKEEDNKG